ncbi:MAG TPA: pitrilysin family protein [Albitalea sp.]|uniref:M16 family metallopeptidase n=1 Tax=Piscinibacter sp. TaxID=1903157 RepID=UPI002ED29E03
MPLIPDPTPTAANLPNGVRILALKLPHVPTASVGIFVRTGSAHETAALNGISHFVEHMVFKGTTSRDARRINLDAERLGAEVNAHTDKDHTAFHITGHAAHAPLFVRMLADLVVHPTFPDAELEHERQVLLQEHAEDADDPMATAYRLFDRACYGLHPVAQPVIGSDRNIERLRRADLVGWVQRHHVGRNVIVAAAGDIDAAAIVAEVQAALGEMPPGEPGSIEAPTWTGGIRTRQISGSNQTHVVLGFPIPHLAADDVRGEVAAALFGEGMSSPLMAELRERRGLVYYAACSADLLSLSGEFIVESSFAPENLEPVLREVARLLVAHTRHIDPVDLERARNQIAVRRLRALHKPLRRLEEAALDEYALQRVRSPEERADRLAAVSAAQVRDAFEAMLAAPASVAIAGRVGRGVSERCREWLAGLQLHASR